MSGASGQKTGIVPNLLQNARICDVIRKKIIIIRNYIMNTMRKAITSFVVVCAVINNAAGRDFNTIMMEATCKIVGKGTLGTGFVIGKPDPNDPSKLFYVLITADHVLRATQGDQVTLVFRQKQKDKKWKRIQIPLAIRQKRKALWEKHPKVDMAAIYVQLPKNVISTLILTHLLIDDDKLKRYEIHPGQELQCLGYPFGAEANALGFPILRSGRIASYPLTPTKETKTFLFDLTVFKGNSGGPVYLMQRDPTYGGKRRLGTTIRGIIGVIVRERNITQKTQELYEKREKVIPLYLGEVVHATFIKELVDSMKPSKK